MEVIVFLIMLAITFFVVKNQVDQIKERNRAEKEKKDKAAAEERAERQRREEDQNYREKTRLGEEKEGKRFYLECVKAGIKEGASEADKARIELFAKRNGIQGTKEELTKAYFVGKGIVYSEKISKLTEQENRAIAEQQKYVKYHGREKIVRELEDSISYNKKQHDKLSEQYQQITEAGVKLYGLAGPAAGLATAIDVQQKNASVRANNASLYNSISQVSSASKSSLIGSMALHDRLAKEDEEALSIIQSCLVEDMNIDVLYGKLNCRIVEMTVTETGTAKIKFSIKQSSDLHIYGDVPAQVDGVLKITIYSKDGREELGSCLYGMEYYLLKFGGEERTVTVYCRGNYVPNGFVAKISPVDLWAIEDWRKRK